ncbi:MAG: hypothetical protein E3J76_06440 [Candidatus Aminicenantes bacterium]|nr:MAG: hypothetical protein E3J76_06440 [Candidatus Aminicenantes bacterium]
MRNNEFSSGPAEVLFYAEKIPYFEVENLKILNLKAYHLRIILSNLGKKGKILRLKKGFYTSRRFLEKTKKEGTFSSFLEFLATKIYSPSYLSLDYVLYQNNILTEIPGSFTLVTKNKTYHTSNGLGTFIYHKIKDSLFYGYDIDRKDDFPVCRARKAKALFDFLYLRKNVISNREMAAELRLNLDVFNRKERRELIRYIESEGSKKMKDIYSFVFEHA